MGNEFGWLVLVVMGVAFATTVAQTFWLKSAKSRMSKMDRRLEELSQLVHTIRRLDYLGEDTPKPSEHTVLQDGPGRESSSPVAPNAADVLWLDRIRTRQNLAQVPSEAATRS